MRSGSIALTIRRAIPSLEGWERTTWIAAVTQFVTLIGFGLGLPFLPMYVQELGVTDRPQVALWSGVLSGTASLSMAVLAPVWGALSDRYGRKPMLVRSMLGGAITVGLMGFVGNVWQLEILRLIQGSVTGSQAAAAALVAAATPAKHAGYALGVISTAVQVGNTFGPALGGFSVGAIGFRGSFLMAGILLLIGGLMAVFWIDEPPTRGRRIAPESPLAALGWPGFRALLVLQLGTQFVYSAAVNLLPIYLQDMQRPDWLSAELASGLSITLTAITAAVGMAFFGPMTDRRGPHGILLVSLIGSGLVLAIQALVPTIGLFLALRAVLGIWLAGVTATLAVMTRLGSPRGREGAAYGASSSAQGLGWGLGPIIGAGVVAVGGIPALYLLGAVLMLLLVLPLRNSVASRKPSPSAPTIHPDLPREHAPAASPSIRSTLPKPDPR